MNTQNASPIGAGRRHVKARLTALLVHGMGASPAWWDPIIPVLERAGITARPLAMPSLESHGPEAWRDELLAQINTLSPAGLMARNDSSGLATGRVTEAPIILIGHSLGAAVCMEGARLQPVACLVLLACPPFHADHHPPPPPDTGLSLTAASRIGRFLRQACANAAQVSSNAVHFVGAADSWVPLDQARRLPFPLVAIARARHNLGKSATFLTQLLRHLLSTRLAAEHLDPGVRLDYLGHTHPKAGSGLPDGLALLGLGPLAPPPARLDLEVTTRCQLACRACARTLNAPHGNDTDLAEGLLIQLLDQLPCVEEMFFVGLGEPLLHPRLPAFTSLAARRGICVRLVTNGLLATPETLARLRDAGLSEVTFSLDSTDEAVFRKLRGNAPLGAVLHHFRSVPAGLTRSIFTTLSAANAGSLAGIVDLAAAEGLPAVAVTDLNFAANQPRSLARNDCAESLAAGIARAREKKVLLVGPHFHETPDLMRSVRRSLVRTAADLTGRTARHQHCLAPWRVAVIGASGNLSPCNCAPLAAGASLQDESFCELWNGPAMQAWRRRVLAGTSPDCLVCPRY